MDVFPEIVEVTVIARAALIEKNPFEGYVMKREVRALTKEEKATVGIDATSILPPRGENVGPGHRPSHADKIVVPNYINSRLYESHIVRKSMRGSVTIIEEGASARDAGEDHHGRIRQGGVNGSNMVTAGEGSLAYRTEKCEEYNNYVNRESQTSSSSHQWACPLTKRQSCS